MTILHWLALLPFVCVLAAWFLIVVRDGRTPPHAFYLLNAAASALMLWGLSNLLSQ